jgi:hypothetical protein
MFLLKTKLLRHNNVLLALRPLNSYGLYWRRLLSYLFLYQAWHGSFKYSTLNIALIKYLLNNILNNIELDETTSITNIQLKKNLQSYQGLWLVLHLPVHGQWTRTNASTQRLLAKIPWKRHFVQWRNWRKAMKENKKIPFNNATAVQTGSIWTASLIREKKDESKVK